MTPSVHVRPCTRDDLRPLEWDGLFTDHREILERTYQQQLDGEQVMLVGEVDGTPLAQVWIDLQRGAPHGAGVVWALRVHPKLQRHGIGTRLMAAAEAAMRDRGFAVAELVVDPANEPARQLYERLGYRVTRRVTEEYSYTTPDGRFCRHEMDLLEMRKSL